MLVCPICKSMLEKESRQYVCENKHCFDIAKQGYTNLYLKSSKQSGDNKEMVLARSAFLNQQFYEPLANKIIEIIKRFNPSFIVDAGCGEGYYTNLISTHMDSNIYAFDLSKEALKYASKRNDSIHFFLSSIFNIPLQAECCDILLNIFAPFAQAEYNRLLKVDGYLIKVDPNRNHLRQMKEILYDDVCENEILNLEMDKFILESYEELNFTMHLDHKAIESLFKMTPYYYKSNKEKSEKLLSLSDLECDASFIIYLYRKL